MLTIAFALIGGRRPEAPDPASPGEAFGGCDSSVVVGRKRGNDVGLDPRGTKRHRDTSVSVATPSQRSGALLGKCIIVDIARGHAPRHHAFNVGLADVVPAAFA